MSKITPNKDELISVIINCHNGEKYIRECIDSVIQQTYKDWELVVWDNCSTDSTSKIIDSYDNDKIKYFKSQLFTPLGFARNKAIEKSKGKFFAFLDCDDVWFPTKLEKQITHFKDPKVGIVICDSYLFNENGIINQLYKNKIPPQGYVFSELLVNYFVSLETAIIRKQCLLNLDQWFDETYEVIEEYDLFTRIGYFWKVSYEDTVLAKWRIHSESLTWTKSNLFPKERRNMIEKYKSIIPNFGIKFSKEISLLIKKCDFEEGFDFLRNGKRVMAREFFRAYFLKDKYFFVLYIFTFLPSNIFYIFQKLRRNLRPS